MPGSLDHLEISEERPQHHELAVYAAVFCGEWYFIKYDDHDMAKALILSEEISTAEVDKVKAHGKGHGELGEVSYLTGNVSKLRQIPNEKHCPCPNFES